MIAFSMWLYPWPNLSGVDSFFEQSSVLVLGPKPPRLGIQIGEMVYHEDLIIYQGLRNPYPSTEVQA